jgi:hypothetical protein
MAAKQLAVLGRPVNRGRRLTWWRGFPIARCRLPAAGRNVERLADQVRRFRPRLRRPPTATRRWPCAAVPDFDGEILAGLTDRAGCDRVRRRAGDPALVGSSACARALRAIEAGKDVAL